MNKNGALQEMFEALTIANGHLSDAAAVLADSAAPVLGIPESDSAAAPPGQPSPANEIPVSDVSETQLRIGVLLSRSSAPGGEAVPLFSSALTSLRSVPPD